MPNFSNLNFNDFRTITPLPSNNQTRGDNFEPVIFKPKPRGASVTTDLSQINQPAKGISTTTIAIIGGAVVLALAGGYWFFTRKKK